MTKLMPFADDTASLAVGGLTVENGTDRIALYGSLDLTRDKPGLARARVLKIILDAVVLALEGDRNLPEAVQGPIAPKSVANPFG